MCSTIERYCCSVKRMVSSARWSLDRRAERACRRPQRVDLDVRPRPPPVASSNPEEPPPFGAHEDRDGQHAADALGRKHPALAVRQLRDRRPGSPRRRPSTSIQREKSGAYGCRWFVGVLEDLTRRLGVPFGAQVHPQPAVGAPGVLEEVGAGRAAALSRGARAPRRSDRARPRRARSARSRTPRLRGRPHSIRPEPPSIRISAALDPPGRT